ncbi:MAG: murein L,D-transpeptidase [Cohaesibacter sp.]|jgi:murein L,D-transpeptidase YafK|nr:murein L,D-transpeptidase [Cohaesibacter sp.]
MLKTRKWHILATSILALTLAACNAEQWGNNKHLQPLNSKIKSQIRKIGSTENAPLYIRIFKEEAVLEAWKQTKDGTYALLKTYPICAYSGKIGPKKKEGDRQAPEGFYAITPGQMNPNSSYYLSFNLGYPNKFDRSYGRTGAHLMVHGSCSSRGCYAMEDEPVAEIYALGREAFEGGQRSFKVHAFPFRMTPENMARNRNNEHFPFWVNLKNGYDHFQITKKPPRVEVCNRTYIFNPEGANSFDATGSCPDYTIKPDLLASLQQMRASEEIAFQKAIKDLENKAAKKEASEAEAMAEAQLDILERKKRIAEGKNPDGFIAGLIQGNPGKPAATQAPAGAGQIIPRASNANAQVQNQTEQSGGGFFSNLTSKLSNPFKKTPPAPIGTPSPTASDLAVTPKPKG